MAKLYNATSLAHEDENDQGPHHFVSLDGERWLEADRAAEADDYDGVREMFGEAAADTDERGRHVHVHHITLATRYLRIWARDCVFHEPIEVTK